MMLGSDDLFGPDDVLGPGSAFESEASLIAAMLGEQALDESALAELAEPDAQATDLPRPLIRIRSLDPEAQLRLRALITSRRLRAEAANRAFAAAARVTQLARGE
jgi:hypothetical protein